MYILPTYLSYFINLLWYSARAMFLEVFLKKYAPPATVLGEVTHPVDPAPAGIFDYDFVVTNLPAQNIDRQEEALSYLEEDPVQCTDPLDYWDKELAKGRRPALARMALDYLSASGRYLALIIARLI